MSTDHLAQRVDALGRRARGSPRPARSCAACAGVARSSGHRDEHRPLALAQVVAGRLAGVGRVAEHAEHVVAQLERLAERQAVRGRSVVEQLGPRRRPGCRRAAAAARRCTWRTCSGSRAGRARRTSPTAACSSRSRYCPAISSVRIRSKTGLAAQQRPRRRARTRRSSSSDQDRHRSPSRIAPRRRRTPRGSRASRAARCRAANRRCADGCPRRVSLPSITSSWIRARGLEQLERGRRTVTISARRRPRRRRASPSSRRPAAAACRRASRSLRASIRGARSSPTPSRTSVLAGQEVVEGLVDAAAQVLGVERRAGRPSRRRRAYGVREQRACPVFRSRARLGCARSRSLGAMTAARYP